MSKHFAKAKALVIGALRPKHYAAFSNQMPSNVEKGKKQKERAGHLCATIVLALMSSSATAATISPTYAEEYSNVVNRAQTQALGSDLFGERINLSNGSTAFTETDVALKTNGQIPLTFGRKLVVNSQANYGGINNPASEILGRFWQVDVPYMRGTFPQQMGWVGSNFSAQRCTYGIMPPSPVYGVGPFHNVPYENNVYWTGTTINVPGHGEEDLLNLPGGRPQPTDGRTYFGATKSEWRAACLPTIKNGSGEGFIVALPDGTKYYFDWMASRSTAGLVDTYCHQDNGLSCYTGIALHRDEVFLYATKAEDRFGNSITYTYDPNNPHRLLSIASSDGASIQISYNGIGKVSTVTTAGRTWTYAYSGDANTGTLSSVAPPDNNSWSYQYNNLYELTHIEARYLWEACDIHVGTKTSLASPGPGETASVVITHPSGAVGEFLFRKLIHGSNRTPGSCTMLHPGDSPDGTKFPAVGPVPSIYQLGSIYSKKITGPGLAPQIWSYTYAPTWSFDSECNPSCASSSQTFVTDPHGIKTTYTFGNDYINNFGQLLSAQVEKSGTVYKRIANTYITTAQGQSFPDYMASDSNWRTNDFLMKFRPLSNTTTTQQGINFIWQANSFDAYANPNNVTRSSTLGYTRTDITAYHHNYAKWVIGQVASSTNTNTGLVESQTAYWPDTALPQHTWAFGKLQQTLFHHANGTLASVTDGNNHTTSFANWKRGIPQTITFADNTVKSAVVDDLGQIKSITDENGYTTEYGYDAIGRLSLIDYPDGDDVNWNNTTITFAPAGATGYGLPAGHWRRTESTGAARKITYFDALWRPVLQEVYDSGNTWPTITQNITRYDADGRPTFVSYPQRSADPTVYGTWANPAVAPNASGTRTTYDALGRPTLVQQNSELGLLNTSYEYLTGFQERVTNPRGYQVTTTYKTYDQPSTQWPISQLHSTWKRKIDIGRDVFGKPTALTQGGDMDGSWVSQTRNYVYNGYQELCKTIEPETGATAMGYDAAGNLTWSATGLALPSTTSCDVASVPVSAVVNRSYDVRNRIFTLTFPDGRGNQLWGYTPDGLISQTRVFTGANQTDEIATAYHYNRRRLLNGEGETVTQPNWYTWGIGYGYDANGNVAVHSYPTGQTVRYWPNALGQATLVTSEGMTFAAGMSYYPNGALQQFTYGNNIVHSMVQNDRQLPLTSTDSGGVLNHQYGYDAHGNVNGILDLNRGDGFSRWMSYDALDRLKTAGSCSFGPGCAFTYDYDPQDNLTRVQGPNSSDRYYCYDSRNLLTNLKSGPCASGATVTGLGYDDRGNVSNKNGQHYDFDFGNRLRGVTGVEGYRYDGLGRRVQTTHADQSLRVWQYSQSGQLMMGWTGPNNQTTQQYIYLAGSLLAIVDRTWPSQTINSIKFQHTDALGTPVAETDTAGNVIQRSEYDPYGRLNNRPLTDGLGYTGHYQDAATGLTYMQQRYYDPQIGRFLSVDPMAADANTGSNFNAYWYANNNPYRFIDPDGRASCSDQNQTCPGRGAWQVFKGMMIGMLNSMMEDAHYSSPNPMVEMYPGELSPANQCNCDYRSPFSTAANNEEQLGRDLAPAASVALILFTRRPTTAIGKLNDLKNLHAGEQTLLNRLPNLGNPRANWKQNSGVLRQEMSLGMPIRDATVDAGGALINNTGFLRAERNLLQSRGWTYDPETTMWNPPK